MDQPMLFLLFWGLVTCPCAISARPNVDFEARTLDDSHGQASQFGQLHAATLSQGVSANTTSGNQTPKKEHPLANVVWDSNEDVETDDNFHTDVGTKLQDVGQVVDAVEHTARVHANATDAASQQLQNTRNELIAVENEFEHLTHDVRGWDHDVIQDFRNAETSRMSPFDNATPIRDLSGDFVTSSATSAASSSSGNASAEAPTYACLSTPKNREPDISKCAIQKKGTFDCRAELNYFPIKNEQSCRDAASYIGREFDEAKHEALWPAGCSTGQFAAGKVLFNSNADGDAGSFKDTAITICSAKDTQGNLAKTSEAIASSLKSATNFVGSLFGPRPTPRPTPKAQMQGLV